MIKKLILCLILIVINTSLNYAIDVPGLPATEIETENHFINEELIEKANEKAIELVGEDYFNQYFTLNETYELYNYYTVKYKYNHPVLIENSKESSIARNPSISFNSDGTIRGYRLPKEPLKFEITKEQALEIGKNQGIKRLGKIDIEYAEQTCSSTKNNELCEPIILNSYAWIIYHPKHEIPVLYIDTENGQIIHSKINQFAEIKYSNKIPVFIARLLEKIRNYF